MMDALPQLLQDWLAWLQPYPLLQALLIVLAFLVLAAISDRLISGIIARLVSRTETDLDDRVLEILHRPVFMTVALVGLLLAVEPLELGPEASLATRSIVKTLLILIWLVFALRFSRLLLEAMRGEEDRFQLVEQTTEPLLRNAIAVVLFVAGVYAILVAWDLDVTGLIASAGILGLALSFAAQDTLSNLFAGIAILADHPYQIGEYIILDSGERGEVTHIGLRSTRLLTRDDVEVSIPNGVMGSAKIVNEASGVPHRYRIRVSVGAAYGSDIDAVMKALLEVGENHPKILEKPEPRVRFRAFGESSLDFDLLCWIEKPADRGRVVHELNCEVYRKFAEAGISIPFPQRDLYIKEMPSG
ncbi:mechanosensitive ion channel family protein [Gemmatimonadota bacterium]